MTEFHTYSQDGEKDPVKGLLVEAVLPCTEPQLEILAACSLGGSDANRAYNQLITINFKGVLSLQALESALDRFVKRHQALRSVFNVESRKCIVYKDLPGSEPLLNVLTSNQVSNTLKVQQENEAEHIFDLRKGPLFRTHLITDGHLEHDLILNAHHLVCDGWSLGLMIHELGVLYSSTVDSDAVDLPQAPLLEDYIQQEIDFESSPEYQKTLSFWTDKFRNYTPASGLPYDVKRPFFAGFKSHHLTYPFKQSTFSRIRALADLSGCSVMVTLASVFEVLLFSFSGEENFVVGIPAAGQPVSGFDRLLGHCVHLLPLRVAIDKDLSFREYLSIRKSTYSEALSNRRLTFGSLIKQLRSVREPGQLPLVTATFNIDRPLSEGLRFSGLKTELYIQKRAYSSFDLIMNLSRIQNEIAIECSYNKNLFKTETIQKMAEKFEDLIYLLSDHPDTRLSGIATSGSKLSSAVHALSKDIESQKQNDFNADQALPGTEGFLPVHRLIEHSVSRFKDKYAIVFRDTAVTYGSLNKRANKMARQLIDLGLAKGDIVSIVLDRSVEMIVSILAVLKAGGAYLPVDNEYPDKRIAFMLNDSGSKFHICHIWDNSLIESASKSIVFETLELSSDPYSDSDLDVNVSSSDPAYIIYTSGSTGQPKGVVLEHGNLFEFLKHVSEVPGLSNTDRLLALTSISFDISILEVLLPYVHGATAFLLDKHQRKEPADILRYLKLYDITTMFATPTHWKMLLKYGWDYNLKHLRVISGGEVLKPETASALLPLCHSLWNIYGPTETTVFSTIKKIVSAGDVTIGKPTKGTDIYLLDAELKPVPEGKEGEIVIAGTGVGRGYLNRPELNAEKFLKDPFCKHKVQMMYRTGDLGIRLENGDYQCIGRLDHQVKVRGHRIELGEIEKQIMALSGIKDVVVIVRGSNDEDLRLKAYVVLEDLLMASLSGNDGDTSREYNALRDKQFREWRIILSAHLPDYMIPTHFVIVKRFPMNANGKIDRNALPPFSFNVFQEDKHVDLQHNEESMLEGIWRKLLGLHTLSHTDNFFELGGHSLIAISVMSEIEKRTGVKLPIASLFEYPTIEKLSELLRSPKSRSKWKSLVPIKPDGSKRPIYIVHGAGLGVMNFNPFIPFLDKDQPVFGLQAHGINKEDLPLETIEEMASNYIEEIVSTDPEGPYHLSGYSAGCVVAFEMAKQLKAAGKTVGVLALLDYSTESIPRYLTDTQKGVKKIQEFIPRMFHTLQTLSRWPAKSIRFQLHTVKLSIGGLKRRLGLNKQKAQKEDVLKIHIFKAMDAFYAALAKYELKPYKGRIDLFVSKEKLYYLKDKKFLGWRDMGTDGVTVHKVDGDHDGMFLPPHNVCFAKTLQTVIDNYTKQHNTQNETDSRKHTHR